MPRAAGGFAIAAEDVRPYSTADLLLRLGAVANRPRVAAYALLLRDEYPATDDEGAQEFVIGVMRWHNRVIAYALTLVTDRDPPFRLAR